jgi:hypothetical protein
MVAAAMLSERLAQKERDAKILETKAAEMRAGGSNIGDTMARVFEAEATAIRQS